MAKPFTDTPPVELAELNPLDDHFAVQAVDLLLSLAVARNASDLHLHPRRDGWEVLFRIDGVLSVSDFLRGGGENNPVTRLMVLANLPTYRSSEPMEGRVRWEHGDQQDLSMRLGVYPTVHGPRAVVRFLRRDATFHSIQSLGLPEDVAHALTRSSEQTDGAIFLSGPAGSGKTTTLYAALRKIAAENPRRSVMTIEDPVESLIDSISQSELDPSGGMNLATALRSAVRQDSEVILVSEMRDPETAEAAFQASLTGHLVYSSLHASDVAASLRRLAQFGVPVHVIESGIRTIISQRLLRKTCMQCGSDRQDDCDTCLGTGYHGRIPIANCVSLDGQDPVGDAMIGALHRGDSLSTMRTKATAAGDIDLRQRAMSLVQSGVTDADEVYRVLGRPDATR
ncbi:MAG: Flp pilus assembly complex ATPase component TadA [Pirellulaceae bacterium]|nr:Flp pilus assembly complex ATPase component TadA [Pirellulaceae bacterium]